MRIRYVLLFLAFSLLVGAVPLSRVMGNDRAADSAAIRAHIESIFQAYIDRDRAKLRATHSKDWHGYAGDSRTLWRGLDGFMQMAELSVADKDNQLIGFKITEFDTVFHGDIALVFFIVEVEGKYKDTTWTSKSRISDVYAKRDGQWIQVASHVAPHPDSVAVRMATLSQLNAESRQNLLEARERVWRAWFSNDQATLEKVIPQEALAINNGEEAWGNRAAILSSAKQFSGTGARLVRLEFPRTEIQLYGATAILYSQFLTEIENNGKREINQGRATEIFVKRNNEWVNTGWHLDSGK